MPSLQLMLLFPRLSETGHRQCLRRGLMLSFPLAGANVLESRSTTGAPVTAVKSRGERDDQVTLFFVDPSGGFRQLASHPLVWGQRAKPAFEVSTNKRL